jgi:putative transcriptional regulator
MKNKLRELRAAREWSQSDLADKLGVSRQTINAIETEKYDPSLPLAFKVARLFKKRIEEIFEDAFSRTLMKNERLRLELAKRQPASELLRGVPPMQCAE